MKVILNQGKHSEIQKTYLLSNMKKHQIAQKLLTYLQKGKQANH